VRGLARERDLAESPAGPTPREQGWVLAPSHSSSLAGLCQERGKKRWRDRKDPTKWGIMVTGDKFEGLIETSRFYEQWLRVDWLLK